MTYDEVCEAVENGAIPAEFPKWQWGMEYETGPIALDPDIFVPRKGILTRYGRKLLEEMEQKKKKYRSIDDPWEAS